MEQTHVTLEVTPNDDRRLAYNLAVPRLVLLSPTPGDDLLTSLRALRAFEIARATLRVEA
jgi:hypothetical protein